VPPRPLTDLNRMPKGADWSLSVTLRKFGSTTRLAVLLEAYPVRGTQKRSLTVFNGDLRAAPPSTLSEALPILIDAVNAAIIYVAQGDLSERT
jgi:hypothetical protein